MYLVDSHCHLHDPEFFAPKLAEEMLKNASEAGVKQIICIGTSAPDSENARAFAESYEGVFWTFGIHPEEASAKNSQKIQFEGFLEPTSDKKALGGGLAEHRPENDFSKTLSRKLVGIGEVGLDYHYEGYDKAAQLKLFEEMLDLASRLNLPVSLHVRDAFSDVFGVLDNFPNLTGVFHSFSDSEENLKKVISRGFYVGINGLATFANLDCYKNLEKIVPLERILLETDAPFLTPKPKRGIINEPAYVKFVASWLSEKLGKNPAIIERKTTENVRNLFRLPDSQLLQKGRSL